jgi:phosphate acetyltransferase
MVISQKDVLENRVFDEIKVGETASLSRVLTRDDIDLFATVSGDINPAHIDTSFAEHDIFGRVIAHGMWGGGLISAVLGTILPGPGTIYLSQSLNFHYPVSVGDIITATIIVREKREKRAIILFDCLCVNQKGDKVISGSAEVIAPTQKTKCLRVELPDILIHRHDRYHAILEMARKLPKLSMAVVHPCDDHVILAAVEAAEAGLIEPLFVGPVEDIRKAAKAAKLSIEAFYLESTLDASSSAMRAVQLIHEGKAQALMKGSLHTDQLMHAVLHDEAGLKTDRRVSHIYAMDVPSYSKPLFVTDAAINIAPTLLEKRDICQNAIDFLHLLGNKCPKVAILSAVETVDPHIPSTLDAAALTMMATRGQITGALVEGPLAFDNAIDPQAVRVKNIISQIGGEADILVVPNLEAGNMLVKQFIHLSDADAAGLLLGTKVPIILTSRSDTVRVRLASVALAVIAAARNGFSLSSPLPKK